VTFFESEQNSVSSNTQPVPISLIFELYDVSLKVILKQIDPIADHLPNFFRERFSVAQSQSGLSQCQSAPRRIFTDSEKLCEPKVRAQSVSARHSSLKQRNGGSGGARTRNLCRDRAAL
jgi:hypothetical protein